MIQNKIKNYILTSPKLFGFVSKILKYTLKVKHLFHTSKYKEIYFISPNKITKSFGKHINIFKESNLIIKEKIEGKNLDSYSVYNSFHQHFVDKLPWEDTQYYQENITKINNGEIRWGCENISDFNLRCKSLDTLFNDIKNNWFSRNPDTNSYGLDEVCIIVGEDWEYYLVNGKHRLIISQILQIETIPVRIIWRHKVWLDIINSIKKNLNGFSYQDFGHEDLDANIIIKRDGNIRYEQITKNLPITINSWDKLLDIGSNIWSLSRKFEVRLGTVNYLSEIEDVYVNILNILKKVFRYKYNIIQWDIMQWDWIKDNKFKLVIALSIFHHFIKTEELFGKFKTFLNNLNTEMIAFESHIANEEQMIWSYKNFEPEEFAEFIKEETWLKNILKLWSTDKKWRILFIIY